MDMSAFFLVPPHLTKGRQMVVRVRVQNPAWLVTTDDIQLGNEQTAYSHACGLHGVCTENTIRLIAGFVANSKYKIQALFKDFQGPKLHFSTTTIIDKKPYPRRGHSKFRLQCDNVRILIK